MNDAEYREWVIGHIAAFPGIAEWMKRFGSDASADITKAWKSCLVDVDKADAIEATRLMNLGDESTPSGFGEHARAVRKVAKRLSHERRDSRTEEKTYVDGEETFNCAQCRDRGWVEVVNIWRKKGSRPMKAFFAGTTNHLPTCGVPCTCRACRAKDADRFNADTMFVQDHQVSVDKESDRFRQWWSEGRHLGRRVGAFDEWNAGRE